MGLGSNYGVRFGPDALAASMAVNGPATFNMNAQNACWAARHTATDTRDVKGVYLNWAAVTTPGTVQVRIETIDATTGKPTGTLYDASATIDVTPTAGWQLHQFASLPTAGRTAGAEYAVVVITTVAGTTHTLRSHVAGASTSGYPTIVLNAADGSTRSNLAEVASSNPVCTLVMEDDSEEVFEFSPYSSNVTTYNAFGTVAVAGKITIPAGVVATLYALEAVVTRVGTPAGDLRMRLFDSSGNALLSYTFDKDSIAGMTAARRVRRTLATPMDMAAGNYRVALDSAGSANSSNCYRLNAAVVRSAATAAAGFASSTTSDVTATPIVWSDSTTDVTTAALVLNAIAGTGSGAPAHSALRPLQALRLP